MKNGQLTRYKDLKSILKTRQAAKFCRLSCFCAPSENPLELFEEILKVIAEIVSSKSG
jgi:hypothetical protein